MRQFNVQDWLEEQRRRKWKRAGKVAGRSDEGWTHEIAKWDPEEVKVRGRPKTRWSDEINAYLCTVTGSEHRGSDWLRVAVDRKRWQSYEDKFVFGMTDSPQ